MPDDHLSLIDRLAGLAFQTKLFVIAVAYMLAMFFLSEAIGDEVILRIWFASALPVGWGLGLLAQWLSMRPRPAVGDAIAGIAALAHRRPLISLFYAIAFIVIEMQAVAWALNRTLIRGL
jgi:hypothetical protein